MNNKLADLLLEAACILNGNLSGEMTAEDIAKKHDVDVEEINKQVELGLEVEKEHTDDPKIAERIALDHLFEIPDYYTRLNKMESDAEAKAAEEEGPLDEDAYTRHMRPIVEKKKDALRKLVAQENKLVAQENYAKTADDEAYIAKKELAIQKDLERVNVNSPRHTIDKEGNIHRYPKGSIQSAMAEFDDEYRGVRYYDDNVNRITSKDLPISRVGAPHSKHPQNAKLHERINARTKVDEKKNPSHKSTQHEAVCIRMAELLQEAAMILDEAQLDKKVQIKSLNKEGNESLFKFLEDKINSEKPIKFSDLDDEFEKSKASGKESENN